MCMLSSCFLPYSTVVIRGKFVKELLCTIDSAIIPPARASTAVPVLAQSVANMQQSTLATIYELAMPA